MKLQNGFTPLLSAVLKKNYEIAKFLIQHGANVNDQENDLGAFPIHLTVIKRNTKILKLLIEHGAFLDSKTLNGSTALIFAIYHDEQEIVEILIENGADVNTTCVNLRKPLHHALISSVNKSIFLLLLQNGASMTAKDQDGLTPIEMAIVEKKIGPLKTMNFFTHFLN